MSPTTLTSRLGVPFRILGLSAVALLLFALTAALCVLGLATVRETSLDDPMTLCVGIACSLIAWLFVFSFHARRETLTLPCADGTNFSGRVSEELMDLGYEVSRPAGDRLVGRPSFRALLFGGTIQVQKSGDSAVLTGPKLFLEQLRQRLRVQSHLDRNRRTLEDSGVYTRGEQLQTVQVHCRVSTTHQHDLVRQLTEALAAAGTTVHCDIHIWAQNDQGIKEATVEKLIAEKLRQAGIPVTVHKRSLQASGGDNANLLSA